MSPRQTRVAEPSRTCKLCPRLVEYRHQNKLAHPEWFNGAVPSFGDADPRLLIVGLAPGVSGANRTGRPFTGDYAGDLLYATLTEFGFTTGEYGAHADDGFQLSDCMITNAVRCVPPANKPLPVEIKTCRPFFIARMASLPSVRVLLALGRIAHDQVLSALELKKSAYPFGHGARHQISDTVLLFDSYHCSRYNTNTGRLTTQMFHDVFADIRSELGSR